MKKILLLLIIFLSTIVFFSSPEKTNATGFQQNVFIYNSTSTILTDYQVKLDFNASNFDFANTSSTGADIYFTDQSDTVLDHWIKTFSNIGTSTIWIKVPSLAANSTTTIRLHYGDNTVTTTYSNASSTFLFYDGFDGDSFADWTGSETNVSGGSESTAQSTSTDKYTSPSYSAKLNMHANCMTPPWNGAGSTLSRTLNVSAGTYSIDYSVWRQITDFPFGTTAIISNSVAINNVNMGGGSSSCSGFGCTYNGSWLDVGANFTTSSVITSLSLSGYADDCTTGNIFYDDVRIRKYTAVEPVANLEVATVNYIAGTGGSITGSSTQSGFAGFNATTVTATPSTGYYFTNWSDTLLVAARTDTNITTNTSFTANFLINSYTLSYFANAGGSISGSSTQYLASGTTGTAVTATADNGYRFSKWSEDDSAIATRSDVASSNQTFTATFERTPSSRGGSFVPPSVPKVITPPSFSNETVNHTVNNVYQMAISETPDFKNSSWENYNEYYKTPSKTLYIKFRSKDGGESKVFVVSPPQINNEAAVNNKFIFKRNLSSGIIGDDVWELQKHLNNNGFIIDKTGVGSPGKESTYFGYLTKAALIKFQKANKINPAVGYFGPATRKVVNSK